MLWCSSKALQLIEFFASKKAEQLRTGEMMVVEGVEVDLRGVTSNT